MSQKTVKVCFISFNSWPLFKKNSKGYFGGAEVQISLIARKLAKNKRFKVSIVVGDYKQPKIVKKSNLTLYKCSTQSNHYSSIIFQLLKTLIKINADIYVERTLNVKVGLVALFCKVFRKKYVYMMAHDWDSTKNTGNYLKGIYQWLFKWGLKQADLVIAQNQKQQKQLKDNYGKQSVLMRSVVSITKSGKPAIKKHILWVGRADKWKRGPTFIQLAKQFPKEKFMMICRQGEDRVYFKKIKYKAQQLENLKFLPAVPFEKIMTFYRQAKILVNTSIVEGFPNTFLQAGATRTPVLSLSVNPDKYIEKYKCGVYSNHSQKKLIEGCKRLLNQPVLSQSTGDNNYQYVKKYHSLKNIKVIKQALIKLCRN